MNLSLDPSLSNVWSWIFNGSSLCYSTSHLCFLWRDMLHYLCRYQPVIGQQHIWGGISSSWGKTAFYFCWGDSHVNVKIPPVMKILLLFVASGRLQEQTSYQDAWSSEPQASSVRALGPLGHVVQIPASWPHQVTSSWAQHGELGLDIYPSSSVLPLLIFKKCWWNRAKVTHLFILMHTWHDY